MLIRHIAIPKHNQLQALRQPTQKIHLEESRQYPNYLNRTLNPELPIDDVLVTHSPTHRNESTCGSNRLQSPSKQSFLVKQYPQMLQDFTNAQFEALQQTQRPSKAKKNNVQIRSQYCIRANWAYLTPILNNKAYLNLKQRSNFSSLEVTTNEPYKGKDNPDTHVLISKGADDEKDQRLVNLHARNSCKNGEVYRTVERFRSRKLMNDDEEGRLKNKKYSLSLPKPDGIHTKVNNKEKEPQEQVHLQKDSPELPLDMKGTKTFDFIKMKADSRSTHSCFMPEHKKRSIPVDDQTNLDQNVRLERKYKSRSCRRTSEEESIINAKPSQHLSRKDKATFARGAQNSFASPSFQPSCPSPKRIEVSYRVSLAQLKSICAIPNIAQYQVIMKIPEIFAVPLFSGRQQQGQLFSKAAELIKHLQIRVKSDISIKKYTNCLLILAGNIAIVWHYNGKVYFGGWKHEVLDEGCKHGIGLQWMPQKFIYYGQFAKNKREGVGIMKNSSSEILAGVWRENKFVRTLSAKVDLKLHGELN